MLRVLGALGIGALAMYYLDPVSGRGRRALLRDRMSKDLRNRALAAEARRTVERRIGQRRQGAGVDIDLS